MTMQDFLFATFGYVVWQILYLVKTEFLDKEKLDTNPNLETSLRWLSRDVKNQFAMKVLRFLKVLGIFTSTENYDSKTLKTKLVFVFSQFLYTVITFLPTFVFYYSSVAHLLYIFTIFTTSTFNGASFYIEIFSKRYQIKIQEIEHLHALAKEAKLIVKNIENLKNIENNAEKKINNNNNNTRNNSTVHTNDDDDDDEFENVSHVDNNNNNNKKSIEDDVAMKKISKNLKKSSQQIKCS
jgi:hypothetical protein